MTIAAKPSPQVAAIADKVTDWLERMRHPNGGYRFAERACHPRCGEASTAATGVLWELNLLGSLSIDDRVRHIKLLQSYQDGTGHFHDTALSEEDRIDKAHPWSKVDEHLGGVCEQALAMFGQKPRVANTTEPIYDFARVDVDELILSLDHREVPWGRCHNVAFSLLWYRLQHGCVHQPDAIARRVYELIETQIFNPADDMPGSIDHPVGNRIAGYYMLTFAYLPFRRPMPNPEAVIDCIVRAGDNDGWIGDKGMCHVWDAMYALNVAGRQLGWSYRHAEASNTASRVAACLMREYHKPDGGFSYYPGHSLVHQNFIRTTHPLAQSDMQGTLMSLACLNIIEGFRQRTHHRDFLQPWIEQLAHYE